MGNCKTHKKKKGGIKWLAPKNRPLLPALRPLSTRVGGKKRHLKKRRTKRGHKRGGTLVSSTQQGLNTAGRDVSRTAHSVGRTTTSAVNAVGQDTGNVLNKGFNTLKGTFSGITSFFGNQSRKAQNALGLRGGKKRRGKKSRKRRRSKKR